MVTGEKFQWRLSFPSSTKLQRFNMAYGYIKGEGKMRDLRLMFEVFCKPIFIVFSVDLNTPNINESILSRTNCIRQQVQPGIYKCLP